MKTYNNKHTKDLYKKYLCIFWFIICSSNAVFATQIPKLTPLKLSLRKNIEIHFSDNNPEQFFDSSKQHHLLSPMGQNLMRFPVKNKAPIGLDQAIKRSSGYARLPPYLDIVTKPPQILKKLSIIKEDSQEQLIQTFPDNLQQLQQSSEEQNESEKITLAQALINAVDYDDLILMQSMLKNCCGKTATIRTELKIGDVFIRAVELDHLDIVEYILEHCGKNTEMIAELRVNEALTKAVHNNNADIIECIVKHVPNCQIITLDSCEEDMAK